MRIEVIYKRPEMDGRAHRTLEQLSRIYTSIRDIRIIDVYLTDGIPDFTEDTARVLLSDGVAQEIFSTSERQSHEGFAADSSALSGWTFLIETGYKPGVTDPVAITAKETVADTVASRKNTSPENSLPDSSVVQTARQYLIYLDSKDHDSRENSDGTTIKSTGKKPDMQSLARSLYNPLIQHALCITDDEWKNGARPPLIYPHAADAPPPDVEVVELEALDGEGLDELSKSRLLALSRTEMETVQQYIAAPDILVERSLAGLHPGITDVELEMIAQTWSEHCKHKIFNAVIEYTENGKTSTITSLFSTYIKQTTELLWKEKEYLRSVFHDNSGVIAFDENHLLCFKAETHNSPSALDPYGGAITGIVGVNRDIIGTGKGAKPIFNTDVLCFGYPDTPSSSLPEGLLHPRRVMEGVHRGIIDGGNQSGIPTVAGAFLFDESYTGKPLVFCGTGGILPAELDGEGGWINHINPGDKAVMVGGRIGKDGIHGATFSSQALDETSPTSAVQIGDPITQKKMLDFLLEARDERLFSGITDNGAGGLSSSLGEMAEKSGGVLIELDRCPLKYQGLAPWEILVSESQERMSLAVPPEKVETLLSLAGKRDVEATVVGEFTDSGNVEIRYKEKTVGLLQLDFLHNGVPVMNLKAEWRPPERTTGTIFPRKEATSKSPSIKEILLALLGNVNIASKETLVRQYDHEVQGKSVVKPFCGAEDDAPTDGAVLRPVYDSYRGITVTHGICPRLSDIDTHIMAMNAVDEAYRAHIACGGAPELVGALDNFCWPDPVESEKTPDGRYKLAQLVRACKGLQEACIAYGIPLISGKDSMKNDAEMGGKKVSVRPTLLISLLGIIEDIRNAVTTDVKQAGDIIVLLGGPRNQSAESEKPEAEGYELGGSLYEYITGTQALSCPEVRPGKAKLLYNTVAACIRESLIASCHDISDGGLLVALAESCLGGRLGARLELNAATDAFLFNEAPSRFVVTVHPDEQWEQFESATNHLPMLRLGTVVAEQSLLIDTDSGRELEVTLDEIENAWKRKQPDG